MNTFGGLASKYQIPREGMEDKKSLHTTVTPVNLAFVAAYCWLLWRNFLEIKTLALLIACTVLLQDRAHRVFSETPCKCKTWSLPWDKYWCTNAIWRMQLWLRCTLQYSTVAPESNVRPSCPTRPSKGETQSRWKSKQWDTSRVYKPIVSEDPVCDWQLNFFSSNHLYCRDRKLHQVGKQGTVMIRNASSSFQL